MKIFWGGIDSKCFKTYFKPKKLVPKKNSRWNFFWDLTIFWQKWTKSENFQNFFLESIQNVLKRILNRKSWFREIFPLKIFFLGLNHFLMKMVKKVKIFEKKFRIFFFLKSIQNVSKRILNRKSWYRKNVPLVFFSGT